MLSAYLHSWHCSFAIAQMYRVSLVNIDRGTANYETDTSSIRDIGSYVLSSFFGGSISFFRFPICVINRQLSERSWFRVVVLHCKVFLSDVFHFHLSVHANPSWTWSYCSWNPDVSLFALIFDFRSAFLDIDWHAFWFEGRYCRRRLEEVFLSVPSKRGFICCSGRGAALHAVRSSPRRAWERCASVHSR